MPQTKSAKKALRQSQKRQVANLFLKQKLKIAVKKFLKRQTQESWNAVQSLSDLAAKKRVIAKNKAARIKSKLSQILPKTGKLKIKPTTKSKRPKLRKIK